MWNYRDLFERKEDINVQISGWIKIGACEK